MSEHDVDSCAEVQTEMRWDMQEAVAQPANHLRNSTVFRPKHINRIFRMLKRRKRLRVFKNLHAYRNTVLRKQLERPLVVAKINVLVSLHALFAWQARILGGVDSSSGPDQRLNREACARSYGC